MNGIRFKCLVKYGKEEVREMKNYVKDMNRRMMMDKMWKK